MKKQLLYFTAVTLTSLGLSTPVNADSAKTVNPANSHTYQRFDTVATWLTAKTACTNLGGYLATITSAAENNWLLNNLAISTWLGGTDEVQEGSWKWITGETWSYSNWNTGEPNNSGNEDYLQSTNGRWNDLANTTGLQLPYVCEWDPIQYMNAITLPDITGDGKADVALLAKSANNYYLRMVNGTTGGLIRPITLGTVAQLTPLSLTLVDDVNANNVKEVAVIYSQPDGSNIMRLYDSSTGAALKSFVLPR